MSMLVPSVSTTFSENDRKFETYTNRVRVGFTILALFGFPLIFLFSSGMILQRNADVAWISLYFILTVSAITIIFRKSAIIDVGERYFQYQTRFIVSLTTIKEPITKITGIRLKTICVSNSKADGPAKPAFTTHYLSVDISGTEQVILESSGEEMLDVAQRIAKMTGAELTVDDKADFWSLAPEDN